MNMLLLSMTIVAILIALGVYLKMDSITKWIKVNKKKAGAIGIGIATVLAGGSAILIPTGDNPYTITKDIEIDFDATHTSWFGVNIVGTDLDWTSNTFPLAANVTGDANLEIFGTWGESHDENNPDDTNDGTIVCMDSTDGSVIWHVEGSGYGSHTCLDLYDVDFDGDLELLAAGYYDITLFNAATGAEIWNIGPSDFEENGYSGDPERYDHPTVFLNIENVCYLYVPNAVGNINSQDGAIQKFEMTYTAGQVTGYSQVASNNNPVHPCHAGLAAEDLDGDGDVEIILNDRAGGGSTGHGLQIFDEDLTLEYEDTTVACSSSCPVVVDIDGDGDFEVVVSRQHNTNAGICVYDYAAGVGSQYTGKYDQTLSLNSHYTPIVYDLDNDGHIELNTAHDEDNSEGLHVWDLTDWNEDEEIPDTNGNGWARPCQIADLGGDPDELDLLCSIWNSNGFEIWTRTATDDYSLEANFRGENFDTNPETTVIADVDRDGLNEIVSLKGSSTKNGYYSWESTGEVTTPEPNTHHWMYSYRRNGVAEYIHDPVHLYNPLETIKWNIDFADEYSWVPTDTSWSCTTTPLAADVVGDSALEIFVGFGRASTTWDENTEDDQGAIVCINPSTGYEVWHYTNKNLSNRCYMELYDVDQDGDLELFVGSLSMAIMLHADTGVELWSIHNSYPYAPHDNPFVGAVGEGRLDKPAVIINVDGTVYLYHAQSEYLCKRNAVTGVLVGSPGYTTHPHYPCHGGLSAEDLDGDGNIELILNDRLSGGSPSGYKSVQIYDTDLNLETSADNTYPACSSHVSAIYDIDDDDDFEVITGHQAGSSSGLCITDYVSSTTINKYTGKWQKNVPGIFQVHHFFATYDVDGDGYPEIFAGGDNDHETKVFDTNSWVVEASIADPVSVDYMECPLIANILGDSDMEIIAGANSGTGAEQCEFYDLTYTMVGQTPNNDLDYSYITSWSVLVADVDRDDLNELFAYRTYSQLGTRRVQMTCYETTGDIPSPEPRTVNYAYSLRRLNVVEHIPAPDETDAYTTTIRNGGIDYFTWMGEDGISASTVGDLIEGFDAANEYIATWSLLAWDATDALWDKYTGDGLSGDFVIDTFDVIMVYVEGTGTQIITMTADGTVDYDATREFTLTYNAAVNKGYNYFGYTKSDVGTLSAVAGKITGIVNGELVAWWDDSEYEWRAWIYGFTTQDYDIGLNDVFLSKLGASRNIAIGEAS